METRQFRHFAFLSTAEEKHIFAHLPEVITSQSSRSELALALGATLYSPGTRKNLEDDSLRAGRIGVASHVWCLEDSIAHQAVPEAEINIIESLKRLQAVPATETVPLLFIRVRTPEQIRRLVAMGGDALQGLTGFVAPKVHSDTFAEYLNAAKEASLSIHKHLYLLPVLETPEIAWIETRRDELMRLRALFDADPERILGVRVGGTDFCGLFGLRRDRETTIWEVAPVRDALSDILNVFTRRGDYHVSGAVWEHFSGPSRLMTSSLRKTPFETGDAMPLRKEIMAMDHDELIREVLLDRANGFSGKTVIHPSHVSIVNSLMSVTLEEFDDAQEIREGAANGGVGRSNSKNKMNEFGPHALWAEGVLERARVYGVLNHRHRLFDLIEVGRDRAGDVYPSASSVATVSAGNE